MQDRLQLSGKSSSHSYNLINMVLGSLSYLIHPKRPDVGVDFGRLG